MKRRTKDIRVQARDTGVFLERLVTSALNGEGVDDSRDDAESWGKRALGFLIMEYIQGESMLAGCMREFVDRLQRNDDPLRKDITLETYKTVWPALNVINNERRKHVERAMGLGGAVSGCAQPDGAEESNGSLEGGAA